MLPCCYTAFVQTRHCTLGSFLKSLLGLARRWPAGGQARTTLQDRALDAYLFESTSLEQSKARDHQKPVLLTMTNCTSRSLGRRAGPCLSRGTNERLRDRYAGLDPDIEPSCVWSLKKILPGIYYLSLILLERWKPFRIREATRYGHVSICSNKPTTPLRRANTARFAKYLENSGIDSTSTQIHPGVLLLRQMSSALFT